jgi:hypothetical protein
MATDTPNFNWPIPEDSDLVRDGAKAIRDLGNAIDTSAEDFGGGLIHIETVAYTTVSSIQVDDCFSADYDNYKLLVNLSNCSVDSDLRLRFVLGTSPVTTSYGFAHPGVTLTNSASNLTGSAQTSLSLGNFQSGFPTFFATTSDILNPNLTRVTLVNSILSNIASGNHIGRAGAGFLNTTDSLQGFQLFPSSGTISGTASIYGYAKA